MPACPICGKQVNNMTQHEEEVHSLDKPMSEPE
jgi:hypothetical protein